MVILSLRKYAFYRSIIDLVFIDLLKMILMRSCVFVYVKIRFSFLQHAIFEHFTEFLRFRGAGCLHQGGGLIPLVSVNKKALGNLVFPRVLFDFLENREQQGGLLTMFLPTFSTALLTTCLTTSGQKMWLVCWVLQFSLCL